MNKSGPIIVIEDDEDDRGLLMEVFKELNFTNEIIYFKDGESAHEHLVNVRIKPFLILSDINMPKLNGIELKERIQNNEDLGMLMSDRIRKGLIRTFTKCSCALSPSLK